MSRLQRVREVPSGPLTQDYMGQKAKEGWKLTAVEWEREVEEVSGQPGLLSEEVPYGLRVAADCQPPGREHRREAGVGSDDGPDRSGRAAVAGGR